MTDPFAGGTRNDFFSRECPQVTIKTDNAAGGGNNSYCFFRLIKKKCNQMWQAQTLLPSISIFLMALKMSCRSSRKIQVFCFVRLLSLSPSSSSSLLSIFYSRSSTIESPGPSEWARLEHRLPSIFIAFTETLERTLLSSYNLNVFFSPGNINWLSLAFTIGSLVFSPFELKKQHNLHCLLSMFCIFVNTSVFHLYS